MAVQKIDPRQPDSTDLEVGHLVRLQRMERGLSQTELAKHIGVTFQQLRKYESGVNRISVGRLTRIAKTLRVDVMYLLGGGRQAAPASNPKERAKSAEAVRMLGRIGASLILFGGGPGRTERHAGPYIAVILISQGFLRYLLCH